MFIDLNGLKNNSISSVSLKKSSSVVIFFNLPTIKPSGWMPSNPPRNFIHRNIHETNPELQKFLDRNNPKNVWSTEQKDPSKIIPGTDFKRDACRFAYKIYAKTHLMLDCDYDYVFWVDADAVFLKPITEEFILDNVLPENNTICYLNRTNQYSECGFVGYNLKNNDTNFNYGWHL